MQNFVAYLVLQLLKRLFELLSRLDKVLLWNLGLIQNLLSLLQETKLSCSWLLYFDLRIAPCWLRGRCHFKSGGTY
jgi:hypothetical protein